MSRPKRSSVALTGSVIDAAWKFNPPALLSVAQTAWFLLGREDATGENQVRRMMDRGVLNYEAEGRRKWIPWSEIQRFKGEMNGEIDP